MKLSIPFLAFLILSLTHSVLGQTIDIRMSIKIITDPQNGNRPRGLSDDEIFHSSVAQANQWQDHFSRGYRFRIAEIVEIDGPDQGGADGPSQFYQTNYAGIRFDVEREAANDPNDYYLRRTNALNVYVNFGPVDEVNSGGRCPIPPGEADDIVCLGFINDGPAWVTHELGHFFGLLHTSEGDDKGKGLTGDDGISDTLPDASWWTNRNQMALSNYGKRYDDPTFSALQRRRIDNTWYNVMSKLEAANKNTLRNRMTKEQLDRLADVANGLRSAFVSGRTRFVSTGGTDLAGDGNSTNAYRTLDKGVRSAHPSGRDIVLLRDGHYDERLTLRKRVTLRAPRSSRAIIGRP